jgi:hypothetical protein
MTDRHPPPNPQTAGDGSPPFDPFTLEVQKAHSSTGPIAPGPMQHVGRRRFGIPAPLLGLQLALAVAVPTVVATLPAGQDASDGNGGGANFSAPADEAQTERAEPPTTDPGTRWLPAVKDCVESLPRLRAGCEILLREHPRAAARYLDCRGLGLPADRCLAALPRK